MLRLLRLLRLQNHGPVFFLEYSAGFFNLLLLLFVRLRVVPPTLMMMKMLPRRGGGGGQKRRHQRKTTSTITLRRRQNARRSHHHRRRCRTTTRRRHRHHLFSLSLSYARNSPQKSAHVLYIHTTHFWLENEKILGKKTLLLLLQKRLNTRVIRCKSRKRRAERVFKQAAAAGKRKLFGTKSLRKSKMKRWKREAFFCFFLAFFWEARAALFYHRRESKSRKKRAEEFFHLSSWDERAESKSLDFDRRRCFFQKNVFFISKKSTRFFTWERAHEREQSRKVFSWAQKTDFAFWGERLKQREQSKKSSFFTRESAHEREQSRKVFSETQDRLWQKRESCFFQKNVFILVVTNIKQSSLCSSSALCAETHFRVQTLSARALFAFRGGVCCCRRCFWRGAFLFALSFS